MEPAVLLIRRLARARGARMLMAAGVVAGWLGLFIADVILSLMTWSDPEPVILLYTAPMLLAVPFLLADLAQGRLIVHSDRLEIRYPRLFRRPLEIPRTQVERILLDDGTATGRARFATGDLAEPLLWTDTLPGRQRDDVPLLGDAQLPNLAIVPRAPLSLEGARSRLLAIVAAGEMAPPRRSAQARALVLTVESLEAARLAFAGWPLEQPELTAAIPAEVADAAERVPRDATVIVALACAGGLTLMTPAWFLFPVIVGVTMWFGVGMVRRRQRQEAAARAALHERMLTPSDRATATAAIDANFRRSVGPPI